MYTCMSMLVSDCHTFGESEINSTYEEFHMYVSEIKIFQEEIIRRSLFFDFLVNCTKAGFMGCGNGQLVTELPGSTILFHHDCLYPILTLICLYVRMYVCTVCTYVQYVCMHSTHYCFPDLTDSEVLIWAVSLSVHPVRLMGG